MSRRNYHRHFDANGEWGDRRYHDAEQMSWRRAGRSENSHHYPEFHEYNEWDGRAWDERYWSNNQSRRFQNSSWNNSSSCNYSSFHNDGYRNGWFDCETDVSKRTPNHRTTQNSVNVISSDVPKEIKLNNNLCHKQNLKNTAESKSNKNLNLKSDVPTSSQKPVSNKNKLPKTPSSSALPRSRISTNKRTSNAFSPNLKCAVRISRVNSKNPKPVLPLKPKPIVSPAPTSVNKEKCVGKDVPCPVNETSPKKNASLNRQLITFLDARTIKRYAEGFFSSRDEATFRALKENYVVKMKPKLSQLPSDCQTNKSVDDDSSSPSTKDTIENNKPNSGNICEHTPVDKSLQNKDISKNQTNKNKTLPEISKNNIINNSTTDTITSPKPSETSNSKLSASNLKKPSETSSKQLAIHAPSSNVTPSSKQTQKPKPVVTRKRSAKKTDSVSIAKTTSPAPAKRKRSVKSPKAAAEPSKSVYSANNVENPFGNFAKKNNTVSALSSAVCPSPVSTVSKEFLSSGQFFTRPNSTSYLSDNITPFASVMQTPALFQETQVDSPFEMPVIKTEPLSEDESTAEPEPTMQLSNFGVEKTVPSSTNLLTESASSTTTEPTNISFQESAPKDDLSQVVIKIEPLEEVEEVVQTSQPQSLPSQTDLSDNALLELLTSGKIKCESEVPQNAYFEKHFDTSVLNSSKDHPEIVKDNSNTVSVPESAARHCNQSKIPTNAAAPMVTPTQPSACTIQDLYCLSERQNVLKIEEEKFREVINELQTKLDNYRQQLNQIQKEQEEISQKKCALTEMMNAPVQSLQVRPNLVRQIETGDSPVLCLQLYKDSVIFGCADGTIKSVSYLDPSECQSYAGHTQKVTGLHLFGQTLYSCSADKSMLLFDIQTSALLRSVYFKYPALCLCKGWQNIYLGFPSGDVITYDIRRNIQVDAMKCAKSGIPCIGTTTQGAQHLLCTASYDKLITLWDADSKLLLHCIPMNISPSVQSQMKVLHNYIYLKSPPSDGPNIFVYEVMSCERKQRIALRSCATSFHVQDDCLIAASVDRKIRFYQSKNDVWSPCVEICRKDCKAPVTSISGQGRIVILADKLGRIEIYSL